jgi:HlyD family secretion protein
MGAQPEHPIEPSVARPPSQPVAWIMREHGALDAIARLDASVPQPGTSRASLPLSWVLAAGGLAVVAATGIIVWRTHMAASGAAPATHDTTPLVSVITPGVTQLTSTVTFTGAIYARFDMPIGVDTDAGRIVAIYVEAGDHVRKGQLLARLTDSVLQPEVDRLAAVLDQARAQAAMSAGEYRRAQSVAGGAGALSAEDVEKRHAAALTDAASVKVAEAQLAQAQARLDRTRIISPVDGEVLTRKAEIGQIASPGGDALFRIAQGGELEMRGQVAEQDLPALQVGQDAQVKLVGVAQPFTGRVRLLGAVIDPQTRLGEIRIALTADPALRPGAFARGSVQVGQVERPVLPQTAVLSDAEGSYVYLVDEHGQVQRRAVHVSGTLDAGLIIDGGLNGTEEVVSTAAGFLREGETVKVAPQRATKAPS